MTPKEKAEELVRKMISNQTYDSIREDIEDQYPRAKQCALIAVDEVLEVQQKTTRILSDTVVYWQEVKNEISKL